MVVGYHHFWKPPCNPLIRSPFILTSCPGHPSSFREGTFYNSEPGPEFGAPNLLVGSSLGKLCSAFKEIVFLFTYIFRYWFIHISIKFFCWRRRKKIQVLLTGNFSKNRIFTWQNSSLPKIFPKVSFSENAAKRFGRSSSLRREQPQGDLARSHLTIVWRWCFDREL